MLGRGLPVYISVQFFKANLAVKISKRHFMYSYNIIYIMLPKKHFAPASIRHHENMPL